MNADFLEEKNHGNQKTGKQQVYNAERKKITQPIRNSIFSKKYSRMKMKRKHFQVK